MDISSILGGALNTYIQARYAGQNMYQQPIQAQPAFNLEQFLVDPITGSAASCKRRRRRRRRLATPSDIRDLAALKEVLGPSMLKAWVATHPS